MNILITGGASGLGEAITHHLASCHDHRIFFTYNNSYNNAKSLEEKYSNSKGILCNFQKQSDLNSLLTFIDNSNINVLINNAFTTEITSKHFHKTDISVFSKNFQANIIPTILITQRVILSFRKNKFGRIINILSSALFDTPPLGWSEYVAEKAYLASLSKSWATENIAYNITSNSISPSFMLTKLTINTDERLIEDLKENHPFKQLLTPNEVSEAVAFLTKCSGQINGINLIINAGSHVI